MIGIVLVAVGVAAAGWFLAWRQTSETRELKKEEAEEEMLHKQYMQELRNLHEMRLRRDLRNKGLSEQEVERRVQKLMRGAGK